MNISEPSAPTPTGAVDNGRAGRATSSSSVSPSHVESTLSSSIGSSKSHSEFSPRSQARAQQPQQPNEGTPIFDQATGSRNYQGTAQRTSSKDTPGDAGIGSGRQDSTSAPENDPPEHHRSKLGQFIDHFGALELENKGSVARDHLALERTFLAWMRTSLAFASIGIAVTQLFRLNTATASTNAQGVANDPALRAPFYSPSLLDAAATTTANAAGLRSVGKPLGSTFIGVSILILLVGFHRYFESQYWIIRGKFPASRGSVALTAFIAGALIVAALAVILAVAPSAYET